MSAVTILKNIFEFAKILNSASHQSVTQWDEKSIKNALDWADYCQELCRQIKDQDYEEDVNSQLNQMAVFLDPVSCLGLSVDNLGRARTLLVESLMSNPTLAPSSRTKLIRILRGDPNRTKVLKEVEQKMSESNKCLDVCTELLKALAGSSDISSMQTFRSQYQATTLLQNFVGAVHNVKNTQRFEKYYCAVFNKLADTQEGWNILVHLFTVDDCDVPCNRAVTKDRVLNEFLGRITQRIQQDISSSLFWSVPTDGLIKASCVSEQFFRTYLDVLLAFGDSFSPQIDGRGLIFWRSANGHTVKELGLHFQRQLESAAILSPERKAKILESVTGRVRAADFSVWKELVRNLLQLLKQG